MVLSRNNKKKKKSSNPRTGGSKVWLTVAIGASLMVAGLVFVILSQVTSTVTYYVLNQDVTARSQVTADMLAPVTTAQGGEPRNAIDPSHLSPDPVYASYDLFEGDILTPSNVGLFTSIQDGIPEDFVVASFSVPAENAVAGKVARGDYIDLIAVGSTEDGGDGIAQYILRHVLVLDTAADLAAETSSDVAAEDEAVRSGVPTLYTVALPEEDAAKLAAIQGAPLLVVLTPTGYDGEEDDSIFVNPSDIFGPDVTLGDSGRGTDPTFSGGEATEEDADGTEEDADGTEEDGDTTEDESANGDGNEDSEDEEDLDLDEDFENPDLDGFDE